MVLSLSLLAIPADARAAVAPVFGTAASFGVLAASAVTNTGFTVVDGDLGVSPLLAVSGFPPGIVTGTVYTGILSTAGQAQADALVAYDNAAGQACDEVLTGQDLGGLTLTPGVYCFASSAQLTGTLTLDFQNDLNAVFIFQMGSTLTTASNATVLAINGPPACNHVVWQVGSSATLGTGTGFLGDILASASITMNTGTNILGSLYALNGAVTLDDNDVTACTPRCTSDAECIDDGNTCTDEICVPDSPSADDFGCTHPNNVLPCDDTNFCSVGDICGGGVCSGTARDCGDGNLCTDDSCSEATDACVNANNVLPCNDTLFCTTGDICGGGTCSGAARDCGDGNLCTDDSCSEATDACVNASNILPCNDGLFCTTGDICGGGICSGAALDCGDGNLCTDDSCNEGTNACVNVNNVLPCNDNQFCTLGDICSGGLCNGSTRDCSDGNICTDDSCNETTNVCVNLNNVLPCDDDQFCTDGDICGGGVCSGPPRNCADENVCTSESCNETTNACVIVNNTLPCNDGQFCTLGDICGGGACGGTPNLCEDGNVCTLDSCNEATDACVSVPDVTSCDDANICTTDSCDPITGCEYIDNALPCDDLNACTLADVCGNGACVSGASPLCGNGIVDLACSEQCDSPSAEICNNRIDDDGDGLIDCADIACADVITEGCDECQLVPICEPIFGDPAVMYVPVAGESGRLVRNAKYDFSFHGRVVLSTPIDLLTEGVTLVLSNANGEIYRGEVAPDEIRQTRRKAYNLRHPREGLPANESGVVSLRIRQRVDGGKLGYGIRLKTVGDFSNATLARMTTQIYLGDDVAYLTADWTRRPGRWVLYQKHYR